MIMIYEDDYIEVFYRNGPSDRTLVTFNGLGVYANGQQYWAQAVADQLDLRCVGVISRSETWFPSHAMREALNAILSRLSGRVFTYGSSMGAYAAIKYSSALGADTVIAFSPQVTISPTELPGNIYAKYFQPEIHRHMRIASADMSGQIFFFYDPYYTADRTQAALMPIVPTLRRIPVPFLRHDTNLIVNRSVTIASLFDKCLALDLSAIHALIRSAKRSHPATHFNVGIHCYEHQKFVWARHAVARAQEMGLSNAQMNGFFHGLGDALESAGKLDEAIVLLREATVKFPDIHVLHARLGQMFARRLQYEEAAKAFRRAIALARNDPGLYAAQVNSLLQLGRRDEALEVIEQGISFCPPNAHLAALRRSMETVQMA
jgi:hypothetical protein